MAALLYESINSQEEKLDVGLDWHDEPEIIYFKNGHYKLMLNLKEYDITDECFCIVNSGVIRKLESLDEKGVEYSIRIKLEDLCFKNDSDPVNQALIYPLLKGSIRFNEFITVSDFGFLQVLRSFNDMVRRYREFGKKSNTNSVSVRKYELDSVADQLMIKADLLHVIALIYSFGMIEDKEVTDTEKQVKAIKDSIIFIREHYKEKLYIRNLSELTGLNEQYFIRFFGSVTGVSPLDYINRYRVEQAARLLKDTDTHVYEIAEECGFHNIGNFIKIFRSVTGETPHKFRKRFGKED
ncbi:AraC-type DNA-binding protein [Oribacterium sp. KHPX15]|uniref:helix-turn-helix transcriptional regulator n=1 Tax=unclassified Oribacterium TaxID=2629782 RepID=UPI0004E1D8B9|nr:MULTISPECIES: AraC family transcriptional regulator [unclassified Oribacterium]SDZ82151.1 AraC-type DNA-binding protein [Oribacterium sp. KHPX15]